MTRALERLALGRAALLSVARAAELMPMRDSEARDAIEAAGIVRRLGGRRVVLWSDCIELARLEAEPLEKLRVRPRLKRGTL